MKDATHFSQLLKLPESVQAHWLTWRNRQLLTLSPQAIIDESSCPIKSCAAEVGEPCKTTIGKLAFHQSRSNEYLAGIYISGKFT
jgi:hypothetical protein